MTMETRERWRRTIVGAALAGSLLAAFTRAPFPQDPAYHAFADRRSLAGVPNFWNVVTNLPFLLVGLFGLSRLGRLRRPALRTEFLLFASGVALVAFGSAYYHLAPSNATLVWDRLPMTVGFMALFTLVVRDRLSESIGRRALWPLLVLGASSVLYWYATELRGLGDLRFYYVVQFLPMLLIPLILLTGRGAGGLRAAWLWATLALYVVAKQAESHDLALYETTGLLSGHSLKHLVASCAVFCAVFAALGPRLDRIPAQVSHPRQVAHGERRSSPPAYPAPASSPDDE